MIFPLIDLRTLTGILVNHSINFVLSHFKIISVAGSTEVRIARLTSNISIGPFQIISRWKISRRLAVNVTGIRNPEIKVTKARSFSGIAFDQGLSPLIGDHFLFQTKWEDERFSSWIINENLWSLIPFMFAKTTNIFAKLSSY